MTTHDHYSTLGVLPEAEDVVITAAYRALAQRYHPDRWTGDQAEAHRRMSEINAAYDVLRDKTLRSQYDKARTTAQSDSYSSDTSDEYSEAFSSALSAAEERWSLACGIFPDLRQLRQNLSAISTPLAFAFVTAILETKMYGKRHEIAQRLENQFLERFFGTSTEIVAFAKELILKREREAAKALNKLVDVMGSNVDPDLLIDRIDSDFGFRQARELAAVNKAERDRKEQLAHVVRTLGYFREARELAELLGYQVEEVGGGFFSGQSVTITSANKETQTFKSITAFVYWVKNNLCRGT